MAHHITVSDTMFSVNETPWHKLGTVLDHPPTIAEAIQLAKLDWTVEAVPNYAAIDHNGVIEMVTTPSKSIVRVDCDAEGHESRRVIASVGPTYEPLQNADAFAWFEPWIDGGQATLETAGTLMGGTRVWILAKIAGDPLVIVGDDIVERYLLLAHAHDGSLAIRAGITPIRVVCHNTLSAAIGIDPMTGAKVSTPDGIFKILHRANAADRLASVAEELAAIDARLAKAGEAFRFLASKPVLGGDDRVIEFLGGVYNQTPEQVRKGRRLDDIQELFAKGAGQDLEGSKGTYWGLYNALTEYHTHKAGRGDESRANANAFGTGAQVIKRGLDVALVMARKTYDVAEVFGIGSDADTLATAAHPDAIHLPLRAA